MKVKLFPTTTKVICLAMIFSLLQASVSCQQKEEGHISLKGISLDETELALTVNDSRQLNVLFTPENATDKEVRWISSDMRIATVDQKGMVKAISEGEAEIRVTSKEGEFTAVCKLAVTEKTIPVTSIILNEEQLELYVGETFRLQAEISPANATDKTLTWTSSSEQTATVSAEGLVTAIADGNVTITAKANDESGIQATCTVSVSTFVPGPKKNLSATGTSNCYIISEGGEYCFDATVIGNGLAGLLPSIPQSVKNFHTENIKIEPKSAGIVWEDTESLIQNLKLESDGTVSFSVDYRNRKGNAVVAVYSEENQGGEILWSWHLWCTPQPLSQTYINHEGKSFSVLDRNLGATDNGPGRESYGVYYQWGRKDLITKDSRLAYCEGEDGASSIVSTIRNPHTVMVTVQEAADWYKGAERNHYLWGNPYGRFFDSEVPYSSDGNNPSDVVNPQKTIYDPCPEGYMVGTMDFYSGFTPSGDIAAVMWPEKPNTVGDFNKGWYYKTGNGEETAWYPAAGCLFPGDDTFPVTEVQYDMGGNIWSSAYLPELDDNGNIAFEHYSATLGFHNEMTNPKAYSYRTVACSVRCIKELNL